MMHTGNKRRYVHFRSVEYSVQKSSIYLMSRIEGKGVFRRHEIGINFSTYTRAYTIVGAE